jgi:thiamine biosynthesis protein ThiS
MDTQKIELFVNGEPATCPYGQFLDAFLTQAGLDSKKIVVEINGQIFKPEQFGSCKLNSRDQVEIIHFVGGG